MYDTEVYCHKHMKGEETTKTTNRKTLKGVVVSVKCPGTAVVTVDRYERHPLYGKYRRMTKRYKAHNPENNVSLGDVVYIESCRPISKEKHFRICNTPEGQATTKKGV